MRKKFLLCVCMILCMVFCMAAVTGCSLTRENPKLDKRTLTKQTESSAADWFQCDYDAMVSVFGKMSEKELEKNLAQNDYVSIAEMYGKMSDEELLSALSAYGYDQAGVESLKKTMIVPAVAISKLIEQHGDDIAAIKAGIDEGREYAKMQKKYGAMKKIENTDYSLASNSASVAVTVSTEKAGKLVVTATYDEEGKQTDWKIEPYQSVGQIMGRAALNTVMAMAIVFLVLIFIALIISCFKIINRLQDRQTQTEAAAPAVPAAVQEAQAPEENLADDLELVAVITAAIMAASEGEYSDGLCVRSIVRRL